MVAAARATASCFTKLARGLTASPRALGRVLLLAGAAVLATACNNNPWPDEAAASNSLYSAVVENSPRHLDPTASYWSNDTLVTYQVYEPLYGYHYLKRPFELVPKAAAAVVKPVYLLSLIHISEPTRPY